MYTACEDKKRNNKTTGACNQSGIQEPRIYVQDISVYIQTVYIYIYMVEMNYLFKPYSRIIYIYIHICVCVKPTHFNILSSLLDQRITFLKLDLSFSRVTTVKAILIMTIAHQLHTAISRSCPTRARVVCLQERRPNRWCLAQQSPYAEGC